MLNWIKKLTTYNSKILAFIFTFFIHLYQFVISPLFPNSCRYHPNCSEYAVQAIEKYGIIKGLLKASYRILRCNPFSKGGHDPV